MEIDVLPEAQKMASAVRPAFGSVKQRTLKTAIGCTGVGLHSGTKVTMVLRPAEANSGIRFRRTDIAGAGAVIPAHWNSVSDTRLNTCVADANGVGVRTIEHLMAALSGMGIDNAIIDISGPEVPVMDGSAAPFLFLVECAGVVEQAAPRRAVKILKPVAVREGDKVAMLTPSHGFSVHMEIDFPVPTIGRQECLQLAFRVVLAIGLSMQIVELEMRRGETGLQLSGGFKLAAGFIQAPRGLQSNAEVVVRHGFLRG